MVFQTLTLFLCLAAALPAGCTRREDSGPPRPETGREAASRRRQNTSAAAEKPLEVQPYTNRDDPFFGIPSATNFPIDFTLGPLYNEAAADASEREVFALISDFFAALNAGRETENYLHPDFRSFLARSLRNDMLAGGEWQPPENAAAPETEAEAPANGEAPAAAESIPAEESEEPEKPPAPPDRLKRALGSFRAGKIRFSGDGLVAQTEVLVVNTAPSGGKARGGVITEKKDGRWYIAGLTIDFGGLFSPPAEKSGEVFDPGPSAGPLF